MSKKDYTSKDNTSKKSPEEYIWNGGSPTLWIRQHRVLRDHAIANGYLDHLTGIASGPGLEPTFKYIYDGTLEEGYKADSEAGARLIARAEDFKRNPYSIGGPAYRRTDGTYSETPDLIFSLRDADDGYPKGLAQPNAHLPSPIARSAEEQKEYSLERYDTVPTVLPPEEHSPEGLLYSFPLIVLSNYGEYVQRLEAVEKERSRWLERVQKYNLDLQKAIGLFSGVVGPRAKVFINKYLGRNDLHGAYRHLIDEARGPNPGALAAALRNKLESLSMESWKDFLTYCEAYDDIRHELKDIGAPLDDLTARNHLVRAVAASNCEDFKVTMKAARGNKWDYSKIIEALHEDYHELRMKG